MPLTDKATEEAKHLIAMRALRADFSREVSTLRADTDGEIKVRARSLPPESSTRLLTSLDDRWINAA